MEKEELLKRIEINPQVMVGKAVVKGTRVTVVHILGLLADGMTPQEIVAQYTRISEEDVIASLVFAQKTLEDSTFIPLIIGNS